MLKRTGKIIFTSLWSKSSKPMKCIVPILLLTGVVAPYMKLRGGVEFIDEIPRSLSGKILRRVLREKAKLSQSKL